MKPQTYNEWLALGYQVMKGEKSLMANGRGEAVFTPRQVKAIDDSHDNEDYYPEPTESYENAEYFNDIGDR